LLDIITEEFSMSRLKLCLLPVLAGLLAGGPATSGEKKGDGIVVDKAKRTITIDAKIAPRKLPNLDQIYPLEVVACWPAPKGQKAHETVVTIDIKPSAVDKALRDLGLKPGKPAKGEGAVPRGPEVKVALLLPQGGGSWKKVPIEKTMIDNRTGKSPPRLQWRFTGSVQSKIAADKDETAYGADLTGTLIAIFPVTDETVLQTNLTMKEEKFLKLELNKSLLPGEGTLVKLVIEASK
jgi:hypothetical protein